MQKLLIVGNWKATPETLTQALSYLSFFAKKGSVSHKPFFLAVPSAYIHPLVAKKKKFITIGAQTVTATEGGAHTGGETISMLQSAGAQFVIIGHSEVRAKGVSEEELKATLEQTLRTNMMAIVCVGESKRDSSGEYLKFIEAQLLSLTEGIDPTHFSRFVVAYEPLWAVNGEVSATEEECFEVAIMLRRTIANQVGIDHAKNVKILYGGSVTKDTARSFIEHGGVDGLLVGRASWAPELFSALVTAAHTKQA